MAGAATLAMIIIIIIIMLVVVIIATIVVNDSNNKYSNNSNNTYKHNNVSWRLKCRVRTSIPNLGERKFVAVGEGGEMWKTKAQV